MQGAPAAVDSAGDRSLQVNWPAPLSQDVACDNFFVGAFDPTRRLIVSSKEVPRYPVVSCHGPNWYLASAQAPDGKGLTHSRPSGGSVAFRGYTFPSIHSYSDSQAILSSWLDQGRLDHDGIYSAAVVTADGTRLTLQSDLLGFGTMYWREFGTTLLFSTNPRFLRAPGDSPDMFAWRSLAQTTWLSSDRSLTSQVHRLPVGCSLIAGRDGISLTPSRLDTVPDLSRRLTPAVLREIEEMLHQALDRCLRLQHGSLMLPLSSGFDSRRFLAALMKRGADFRAVTRRVIQSERLDLDARFASVMAKDLGFAHTVVDANGPTYMADDRTRRVLLDGEAMEHTWSLRLFRGSPSPYGSLLDGIAGDVLGDPVGWTEQLGIPWGEEIRDEASVIAEHAIRPAFNSIFRESEWPSMHEVRDDIRGYLAALTHRRNMSELSFLLLRQRRVVGLASQQLTPPGVVPFYPYLDPEYVRLLLSIEAEDRHQMDVQRSCLREFWPQYYAYPGTRSVPPELQPDLVSTVQFNSAACQGQLRREVSQHADTTLIDGLFTPKARMRLRASRFSSRLAARWAWFLHPVLELAAREARAVPVWEAVDVHP